MFGAVVPSEETEEEANVVVVGWSAAEGGKLLPPGVGNGSTDAVEAPEDVPARSMPSAQA